MHDIIDMAEAFGIGAGVLSVIGLTIQIIQATVQFGRDWKDAPADVRNFVAELQALKTVLSETNTNVILNQDFADAFHGRHSALLSQLGPLAQDTDTAVMVLACQDQLRSLLDDLTKRVQSHHVGWERLKGAFQAVRIREAVENLHRQCLTLNQLLAADSLVLTAGIYLEVKEGRKQQQQMNRAQFRALDHIRNRIDIAAASQDQQIILNWLTAIDYTSAQSDFINQRQQGTGQWLLESTKYKAWVEAESRTLFCPGIPGAGKTFLTSIVVDDLSKRFHRDEGIGITYLYCNFRRQHEQKAEDLFASLLKQLTQSRPSLPDSVKVLHDSHKYKRTRPSFTELSRAVQSVSALYSKVFIVIDALDECHAVDRSRVISEILAVQGKCGINFLATSRYIPEIMEGFGGSASVDIRATEHDIRAYIDGYISRLPRFVQRNSALQEEVKKAIIKAVDGMYVA